MDNTEQSEDGLPLADSGIERTSFRNSNKRSLISRLKWLPLLIVVFLLGGFSGLYFFEDALV